MNASHSPAPSLKFPIIAAAAIFATALAIPARAESHVSVGLNLVVGPPAPVVVQAAPPAVVADYPTYTPGPGYVWVAGHNSWVQGRWIWISGTWVRPPQPDAIYVEGRWDARVHTWVESHWEIVPHYPYAVWIEGHWVVHGHHQNWIAGHWEEPPHGRRTWVAANWENHGHGYVYVEGHWR